MPLFIPIIAWSVTAVVGGAGIWKGASGVSDIKKAKRLGEQAESRHQLYGRQLDSTREQVGRDAAAYGKRKIELKATSFKRLVDVMGAIGQRCTPETLRVLLGIEAHVDVVQEFRAQYLEAESTLKGLGMAGTAAGAAVPATYLAAGLVGVASTGTAIGTLSGAAATNATLAWLGGGSLATGGWGMAAGTVVLGGLVAAPALLIGGFTLAVQGEKALTRAAEYKSTVDRAVAEIETMIATLRQMKARVSELHDLVERLDARLRPSLDALERVASEFDEHDPDHTETLRLSLQLAFALSEIMSSPVLDEQGTVTSTSGQIVAKYREFRA